MNYNNLAQKTNFIAGSDQFQDIPFFLTSVNIPGMNFGSPEVGGKHSIRMKLPADSVIYNGLSFEMLVDEDFVIYTEIMTLINKHINIETGAFSGFTFDFWVQINNNKGNKILKFDLQTSEILLQNSQPGYILELRYQSIPFRRNA